MTPNTRGKAWGVGRNCFLVSSSSFPLMVFLFILLFFWFSTPLACKDGLAGIKAKNSFFFGQTQLDTNWAGTKIPNKVTSWENEVYH